MKRRRLAGTSWRVKFDEAPTGRNGMYGPEHHISSADYPPTVFDELVIDRWLHLEQMNTGLWWLSIAGLVVFVRVDRDGRPTRVTAWAPGSYNHALPGVVYDGDLTDLPLTPEEPT